MTQKQHGFDQETFKVKRQFSSYAFEYLKHILLLCYEINECNDNYKLRHLYPFHKVKASTHNESMYQYAEAPCTQIYAGTCKALYDNLGQLIQNIDVLSCVKSESMIIQETPYHKFNCYN